MQLIPSLRRIHIKKSERALLLRNGDFERVLRPGRHWLFNWFDALRVEVFATEQAALSHGLSDCLMNLEPAAVAADFLPVTLGESQVALRFQNDLLVELHLPGSRRLFWLGVHKQRVEVLNLAPDALGLPADLLAQLNAAAQRGQALAGSQGVLLTTVPEQHAGVVRVNGQLKAELLQPGLHGFWRCQQQVEVDLFDLRSQLLEISGQEILTKDKVALRLNLGAAWRYGDLLQALGRAPKPVEALYRELQFALRTAVGTRTLDELLEDKSGIDAQLAELAGKRLQGSGLVLESIGVKDIILPGEMKLLLAQVVEAEKAAQANVIRRREETAATRSLMNTAKLMEDNPTALRMKELETLERVAERIDKISVFGGLDGVLNNLIKIR
jgi:regulator of protease activity HflC (stomatin/prohibitin superfamily)